MGNETNHGKIGHHNYPTRGGLKNNSTGCTTLDSNGIAQGQYMRGIDLCLNCVMPECVLTVGGKRGPKAD